MLGVLKRRWKPKRAGAGRDGGGRLGKPGLEPDLAVDKNRAPTSPRQIHPMCEEKLHLVAYEGDLITGAGETPAPPGHQYPLAPNICVEGGRIEFIKAPPPADSATAPAPPDVLASPPAEKSDIAKECLEARILELEAELVAERQTSQREKLQVAKLQRQLARREVLQRDVDRERRLRLDSECRLRTSASEAERCRARLQALQREFSRMEETVRSMLQYKSRYDQVKHDKHQLSVAYENRVQQFQNALSKLNQENEALKKQLHSLEAAGAGEVQTALIERLRELEQDNRSLTRESDAQRRQYERCLDDVANQVVRALLAQKSLREEIETLQQRVRDLETQNRTLSTLLLQQITSVTSANETTRSNPTIKLALPAPGRPASCDDARLRLWRDSVVWLPLQRPSSLDLDCCQFRHRAHPNVPRLGGKEEDEGSESPESGNRDEGYSTMSSDVQGPGEATARRGLEDLKEASDETDTPHTTTSSPDRLPEPDLVLIPLSLALSVASPANRHSFPPVKELLPFQHVMRSFSDSHLCLKLAPSPAGSSYSLTSAESVMLQGCHYAGVSGAPLRHSQRSRGANTLLNTTLPEEEDDSGSWCSGDWWDADYVQHWLRLDETRSALQQQMEYDAAELEDWTMDPPEDGGGWRSGSSGHPALTHSQTLPSIQESIAAELEEDSSECLWNSSSYLSAGDFKEAGRSLWPYNRCLVSPGGDSWSSVSEDANGGSKRSSAAMSTDSGDLSAIGTDFTRDFYRLVKFESTKSLASTSSRSQAGDSFRKGEIPPHFTSDREQALQSVLHFIAEQQQYVLSREVLDTRPAEISLEEMSPNEEFTSRETAEEIAQICEEVKLLSVVENEVQINSNNKRASTSSEVLLNEYNVSTSLKNEQNPSSVEEISKRNSESLIVNSESSVISLIKVQNSSNTKLHNENCDPSDNVCKETSRTLEDVQNSVEIGRDKTNSTEVAPEQDNLSSLLPRSLRVDISRAELRPVPEEDEDHPTMSESLTSTLSTPETVLKARSFPSSDLDQTSSMATSTDSTAVLCSDEPVLVNGSKTLNFHERATSKDVIDELNRMIRKGEEKGEEIEAQKSPSNLDTACCCPTGWVHVEREIDFTDPKARANLLDVMLAASRSSSSAATTPSSSISSSSSSPANSDSGEEPQDYQHLHRLHRFRRQKKASATREPLGALRCPPSVPRVSIIGRDDFFVRFGDKEREAVASFDFLEELSTTSVSGGSSCDQPPSGTLHDPPSPSHLSLSDSCAASFSGSEHSLDAQ